MICAGKKSLAFTFLTALLGAAAPASAHHSYAMFDAGVLVTAQATVKELQWTNPHSWLQVLIVDDKGVAQEWSLEMGPLVVLHRWGWKPHTLNPGDKVKVTMNPLRDGTHGGRLMRIVLPDGQTLGGQGDPQTHPITGVAEKTS